MMKWSNVLEYMLRYREKRRFCLCYNHTLLRGTKRLCSISIIEFVSNLSLRRHLWIINNNTTNNITKRMIWSRISTWIKEQIYLKIRIFTHTHYNVLTKFDELTLRVKLICHKSWTFRYFCRYLQHTETTCLSCKIYIREKSIMKLDTYKKSDTTHEIRIKMIRKSYVLLFFYDNPMNF